MSKLSGCIFETRFQKRLHLVKARIFLSPFTEEYYSTSLFLDLNYGKLKICILKVFPSHWASQASHYVMKNLTDGEHLVDVTFSSYQLLFWLISWCWQVELNWIQWSLFEFLTTFIIYYCLLMYYFLFYCENLRW